MRSVALIVLALVSIPQAALGQQQLTAPRTLTLAPFVVDSSAAADATRPRALSLLPLEDRVRSVTAMAPRKRTLVGAGLGFILGAGATWAILHTGGSTAPCDRGANQDAMSARECAGITILGGGAGALVGALIARLL